MISMSSHEMKVVARIKSPFSGKFGIPRQSGLVPELRSTIVFEPEYRNPEALRGMEGFSHLWLIWQFSEAARDTWSPTVRPPRLGGNTRMGVFATRSPFRPNPIGLSCVEIVAIEEQPGHGTVIVVSGADLMDGTPIYDIKPYTVYADCHPEARSGFASTVWERELELDFPSELRGRLSNAELCEALCGVLRNDPRPSYHNDPERVYGMDFGGYNVKFSVSGGVLKVLDIKKETE